MGSWGKSWPSFSLTTFLNSPQSFFHSSAVISVSSFLPVLCFRASIFSSKLSLWTSSTTSEYIMRKRR